MFRTPITFFVVLYLSLATEAFHLPSANDWNSLLFARNIFHEDIRYIRSKSADKAAIVEELKTILEDKSIANDLYKNYLKTFKNVTKGDIIGEYDQEKTFKEALVEIAEHNLETLEGKHTWTKGVNRFTDLTNEEFSANYKGDSAGLIEAIEELTQGKMYERDESLPTVPGAGPVDWKEAGKVSSVKNQGRCASCVTFATSATLESLKAISTGRSPKDYSAQEILDCCGTSNICQNGMDPRNAMKYLQNNGVALWSDYPYEDKQGSCRRGTKAREAKLSNYQLLSKNENAMRNAVDKGPISILLSSREDFKSYSGGVFQGKCGGKVDHAVVIVGYGNSDGTDTWLIKNSWGETWGESGFMRLKRGSNVCSCNAYPYAGTV